MGVYNIVAERPGSRKYGGNFLTDSIETKKVVYEADITADSTIDIDKFSCGKENCGHVYKGRQVVKNRPDRGQNIFD